MDTELKNSPAMQQRLAVRKRPTDQRQVMYQSWRDLLFLHWPLEAEVVQDSLPSGLTVDTWEGKAYLGIVPFLMRNIRPKFFPAIPGISNFHEINLRTYVYDQSGRPGVWFYSLDANQWLAVRVARKLFQLPYFDAKMSHTKINSTQVCYSSQRKRCQSSPDIFEYQVGKSLGYAEPGTFEFFLTERYVLYAARKNGNLYSGQVVHPPYELQKVEVAKWDTSLIELSGFEASRQPPVHAIFSPGVDVDVFPIQRVK